MSSSVVWESATANAMDAHQQRQRRPHEPHAHRLAQEHARRRHHHQRERSPPRPIVAVRDPYAPQQQQQQQQRRQQPPEPLLFMSAASQYSDASASTAAGAGARPVWPGERHWSAADRPAADSRRSSPSRQRDQQQRQPQQHQQQRNYEHTSNQQDEAELASSYFGQQAPPVATVDDMLPAPLPFRRPPPPPPPVEQVQQHEQAAPEQTGASTARSPQAATESAEEDEDPVNIDDVVLDQRWSVHVISHLYYFQRRELGGYAHELVKFLRGHALMNFEQEFGYSVSIRHTRECLVFQVAEARDLHAEFLLEKMEQPQRTLRHQPSVKALDEPEVQQRKCGFVIYFPQSSEDDDSELARWMPGQRTQRRARATENGSDSSYGSGSSSHREPKYAILMRGNEELMAWVCSWLQRRFQCVVGKHIVRVTSDNLRRLARNWVVETLEREARADEAALRVDAATKPVDLPSQKFKAPLLLKYRATNPNDVRKAFTLTIPWAAVRRAYASTGDSVSSALGGPPELIEILERQYFANLATELSSMELTGFQMAEVDVDTHGTIKFLKTMMVHSILQSFLDIFALQQVPGPSQAEITF